MTREQIASIDVRTLSSDPQDLRAECRQLIRDRAALLEGAKFLLEHHPTPLQSRWASQLRNAVDDAQKEWKRPRVEPLPPGR